MAYAWAAVGGQRIFGAGSVGGEQSALSDAQAGGLQYQYRAEWISCGMYLCSTDVKSMAGDVVEDVAGDVAEDLPVLRE